MIAVPPGEILREEYMAPLGLTASTLALELRIPASRMHEIINEKRGISVDTALRLAETDLNLWGNLQAQYEADSMDAQKRTDMERIVPYSELQLRFHAELRRLKKIPILPRRAILIEPVRQNR